MSSNNKEGKKEFDSETRIFFETITSTPILQIPYYKVKFFDDNFYEVCLPLRNAAIILISEKYLLYNFIRLKFVEIEIGSSVCSSGSAVILFHHDSSQVHVRDGFSKINTDIAAEFDKVHFPSQLPFVFVSEMQLIITGLSSILRFLVKLSYMKLTIDSDTTSVNNHDLEHNLIRLLGFRTGCLQACAEVSVWTKFCEVDIFEDVKRVFTAQYNPETANIEISRELFRFEYHLREPVKIHNIRKQIAIKNNQLQRKSGEPCENANVLQHEYAEGPEMLLSDLIIFPCIHLFVWFYGNKTLQVHLPNTFAWYLKMSPLIDLQPTGRGIVKLTPVFSTDTMKILRSVIWQVPLVPEESLYKSDRTRYNPKARVFTRPADVDEALKFISDCKISLFSPATVAPNFIDWNKVPELVTPGKGGKLPVIRTERKCHQISSITEQVINVVQTIQKHERFRSRTLSIVDFCSGGGHVGILLAFLLPKCQIVLVENNEDSLRRGWSRVARLGLTNVLLYQCNLDYFDTQFDIGVSLHACGTATDLVLQKCISAKANFVSSPCCYGGIRNNHMLHYPRSCIFRDSGISLKHYFILAHSSDQTHDEKHEKTEQGKFCMRIIDTDRCFNAKENGYQVALKKINPETASPKNHILVGIHCSNA